MRLLIARGRGSGRASIRARSYLQFSFVNNKPWRRRGLDFNEGINNPGCAAGSEIGTWRGRRGGGREYTAGVSEIRAGRNSRRKVPIVRLRFYDAKLSRARLEKRARLLNNRAKSRV